MISVKEAIHLVKNNSTPLTKKVIKPLEKAGGYLLYNNIISPINMPPFRQSAMDGYAIHTHDAPSYKIIGEIKAGDNQQPILKPGEAVRIFTGAAVPDTANAIVMQEKVLLNGTTFEIETPPNEGLNIRPLGEQVKQGHIALKKGTKLTPAAIGYLTSLGITEVQVLKKPSIALITTGNELIKAGQALPYGKIYESNSKMLLSALYNLKFYDVIIYKIEDNYAQTVSVLKDIINLLYLAILPLH